MLFMFRVCHAILTVHCSLAVICLERAGLLALFYVMFYCVLLCFCPYPMWWPGSGVVLDYFDS